MLIPSGVLNIFIVSHSHLIALEQLREIQHYLDNSGLDLSLTASFQGIDSLSLGTHATCEALSTQSPYQRNDTIYAPYRYQAVHGYCTQCRCRAEQKERASAIRAFSFARRNALVTYAPHALEGPVRQISVHLVRRDETRQNRFSYAEKSQKDRSPSSVRMLSKSVLDALLR